MSRAVVIKALCAILLLLAAPATATAQSGGEGNDRAREGGPQATRYARVRLTLANGDRFRPVGILFNVGGVTGFGPAGARFLALGDAVEQRDESKIDLGFILGRLGLSQDTTSSEFRGAERVGDVYRIENIMVVDPLPGTDGGALATSIKTTVVANQGVSFVIGGIYGPVEPQAGKVPVLGDIPLLGEMFRSRIGDAYRKRRSLLILVTPTLVDIEE